MGRRKIVLLLAIGLLLTGCAAGGAGKLNQVKLGMTEAQVLAAIGTPSTKSASGDTTYLHYNLYSDWFFPDMYFVRLSEGKVDAYGRKGEFNLGY